ncbi:MAG: hypothetical protein ABSD56_07810 [Bryobacteraceae bacterium]
MGARLCGLTILTVPFVAPGFGAAPELARARAEDTVEPDPADYRDRLAPNG